MASAEHSFNAICFEARHITSASCVSRIDPETENEAACRVRKDLKDGGVIAELALHTKNIPDWNLNLLQPLLPKLLNLNPGPLNS